MNYEIKRIKFTSKMKKDYTILFPNMCDIHFRMLKNIFDDAGYNTVLLTHSGQDVIDEGLKYVHNDTCYPALLTIGQMINALNSGKYDINKTALMLTQTGGGCRASNYIHLLRKALEKAGYAHIPVISINFALLERNSGFKITLPLVRRAMATIIYGDLLMTLHNQTKPYEVYKGESEKLVNEWVDKLSEMFSKRQALGKKELKIYTKKIVDSFEKIEIEKMDKVKVGIVGEIYVKYSPFANNDLEQFLYNQGCEVMVPPLFGFIIHVVDNNIEDKKLYSGNVFFDFILKKSMRYLLSLEKIFTDCLSTSKRYHPPAQYLEQKELVKDFIGYGCKMGEGWLLTAEMVEFIQSGYENIVCVQPFGCLPNHIVGKGMARPIKDAFPNANIVAIDYDASATKVNQENRIKLMLAVAKEKISRNLSFDDIVAKSEKKEALIK